MRIKDIFQFYFWKHVNNKCFSIGMEIAWDGGNYGIGFDIGWWYAAVDFYPKTIRRKYQILSKLEG